MTGDASQGSSARNLLQGAPDHSTPTARYTRYECSTAQHDTASTGSGRDASQGSSARHLLQRTPDHSTAQHSTAHSMLHETQHSSRQGMLQMRSLECVCNSRSQAHRERDGCCTGAPRTCINIIHCLTQHCAQCRTDHPLAAAAKVYKKFFTSFAPCRTCVHCCVWQGLPAARWQLPLLCWGWLAADCPMQQQALKARPRHLTLCCVCGGGRGVCQ
jgi:hypothetical protein